MTEPGERHRPHRRWTQLGMLVLAAILLALTLGGISPPDEATRLEERQARSAAMLIAMEATNQLQETLSTRIRNALPSDSHGPIYSVSYYWHDVRSRRQGTGEYRVWVTVSLLEQCIPQDATGSSHPEVPGTTALPSVADQTADCEEQKAILKPLLDEWLLAGCEEPAEFLVVAGTPPTTDPLNACAQNLLDATGR